MRNFIILFCSLASLSAYSQSVYTQQTFDYNHLIDRYEVLSGNLSSDLFTAAKPYKRVDAVNFMRTLTDTLQSDSTTAIRPFIPSKADAFNLDYINTDNWEFNNSAGLSKKPILQYFYQKKNALYAVDNENFKLVVNPIISVWAGKETKSDKTYNYLNTRGAEVRGMIDNKVGFYTSFTDNQAMLPMYVRSGLRPVDTLKSVLMGENYLKTTPSGAVDYISARGYITFNVTKHIGVQFGHDKNFIGNGYRSLVLSENSGSYNFLKLQTKVWKFQYTNLFCQMTAVPTIYDSYFPKKYFVLHHLSTNIGKHFNVGIFESVVYGNRGGGLDINYMNPIIFYRAVEQNLGSSDNASLGGDWKLNFLRHFSWYGQVMIDEFLIKNVRARNGSWTNKQAFQSGLKYVNAFGIKNLDLQAEFNAVRPYTYAHMDNFRNYSNYLQPIAHPRGANFKEWIGILRYQPFGKLCLTSKFILVRQGADSLNSNFSTGSNILMNYSNRITHNGQADIGHRIGQGISSNLMYFEFLASYMIKHNIFIDAHITYRKQESTAVAYNQNNTLFTLGIRMNMAKKSFDW